MTEQEIISFLKENRRKCIAFMSLPPMVKDWCNKHKNEKIFNSCFCDGWQDDKEAIRCVPYGIYALPENYKKDVNTEELKTYVLERMENDPVFREQASELINLFENDLRFRREVKDMIIGTSSKIYCKCIECKRIFKYSDSVYPLDDKGRPGWCVCSSCFSKGD